MRRHVELQQKSLDGIDGDKSLVMFDPALRQMARLKINVSEEK